MKKEKKRVMFFEGGRKVVYYPTRKYKSKLIGVKEK